MSRSTCSAKSQHVKSNVDNIHAASSLYQSPLWVDHLLGHVVQVIPTGTAHIIRLEPSHERRAVGISKQTGDPNRIQNVPAAEREQTAVEGQHDVVHAHLAALEGELRSQVGNVPWSRRGHTRHVYII